jgi:hypothetical protein
MARHPTRTTVALAAACLLAAGAARADCAGDFARDNRVQPQAGPFRLTEERVPVSRLDDGRWVPTLRQGKVTTVSEVVPASQAFRITTDAPFGDQYVGIGRQVWTQSLPDGPWQALDAERARLLAAATATYLLADDMSELACTELAHEGRPMRVYRYQVPGDGLSSLGTTITARFDARSGRPLSVDSQGAGKANGFSSVGRFAFDRRIRVQPPTGAQR